MTKIKRCLPLSIILIALSHSAALFAAEPPKDVIPKEDAQKTALKKYPGSVKESELEQEKGRWVYSFDIEGKDKKLHEVWIDARTGKMVAHKVESETEEAQEHASNQ